jgi:hypothetical protein
VAKYQYFVKGFHMTTASTSLLGLALPVQGELEGAWGDTVNNSITSLLDTAIAGTTTLSADSDVTLSTTTLASNQARQAIILWTASGTTTRYITAPAQSKTYVVINKSTTQSIVIRGVGPTTGVTVAASSSAIVAWNGTDFANVSGSGTSTGPRATVYTTAGTFTFTIPTGVTNIKVTVVGGGGGGAATQPCAGSANGTAGGTSSVASGTQTISTISATGGGGGGSSTAGGLGSGGDINNRGFSLAGSQSGGTILSGGTMSTTIAALSGAGGAGNNANSGAGGGNAIKWLTSLTGGNTLAVTVGSGGTGGNAGGGYVGSAGAAGVVIFEY